MAYTTINKSTDHFNTKLYTGTGSAQSITGVGFQPDWTWTKKRNGTTGHRWVDAVRGVTKAIFSNGSNAESTESNGLTAFASDGYSLGTDGNYNSNGDNYASWNWKANGQGSSNTDGSINTTYTSANTTAGFSISKYTGTGSNATVGHGLGVAPKMIMVKCTSEVQDWFVYHTGIGTNALRLNGNGASEGGVWNSTAPTNSVFSIGTAQAVNKNYGTYVAYCFAEKLGYSKFGTYEGNGNADGTFVYTGFKPAFVLVKRYDGAGLSWRFFDSKRNSNGDREFMYANLTDAESGGDNMDFLSNGFKSRNTSGHQNGNSDDYIYMAFGQSLVGSNNVPATAR